MIGPQLLSGYGGHKIGSQRIENQKQDKKAGCKDFQRLGTVMLPVRLLPLVFRLCFCPLRILLSAPVRDCQRYDCLLYTSDAADDNQV